MKFTTLEEESKNMTKDELRLTLLDLNETFRDFEEFLIEKLGKDQYFKLSHDFAPWKFAKDLEEARSKGEA